jgi:hypothetical protein
MPWVVLVSDWQKLSNVLPPKDLFVGTNIVSEIYHFLWIRQTTCTTWVILIFVLCKLKKYICKSTRLYNITSNLINANDVYGILWFSHLILIRKTNNMAFIGNFCFLLVKILKNLLYIKIPVKIIFNCKWYMWSPLQKFQISSWSGKNMATVGKITKIWLILLFLYYYY